MTSLLQGIVLDPRDVGLTSLLQGIVLVGRMCDETVDAGITWRIGMLLKKEYIPPF